MRRPFGDGTSMKSTRVIRVARDGDTGPMGPIILRTCQCGREFLCRWLRPFPDAAHHVRRDDFRFCKSCRAKMARIAA